MPYLTKLILNDLSDLLLTLRLIRLIRLTPHDFIPTPPR